MIDDRARLALTGALGFSRSNNEPPRRVRRGGEGFDLIVLPTYACVRKAS